MPKLHFIKQSHGLRSLGRAKLSDKRLVMHVAQEIKNPCERLISLPRSFYSKKTL